MRELVGRWAQQLGISGDDLTRWMAAAMYHDALRDLDPSALTLEELAASLPGRDWPPHLLHGPVCAFRLRREGVADEELLQAITYHTTGHPDLGLMGEVLYLADFLDPGREFLNEERARLRERLPEERTAVLREVVALRLKHLIDRGSTVLDETLRFWNRLVGTAR